MSPPAACRDTRRCAPQAARSDTQRQYQRWRRRDMQRCRYKRPATRRRVQPCAAEDEAGKGSAAQAMFAPPARAYSARAYVKSLHVAQRRSRTVCRQATEDIAAVSNAARPCRAVSRVASGSEVRLRRGEINAAVRQIRAGTARPSRQTRSNNIWRRRG